MTDKSIILLLAGLALLCSCSIKEDRRECPCYLELVPDERMEACPQGRLMVSVFEGERTEFRTVFTPRQVDESDYGEISLRRGYVDVNALWGVFHGVVRGFNYMLPEGSQMDSLYASTRRGVDATGELATASIFDAKQFCTIGIKLLPEGVASPFDLQIRGDVAGLDLRTLHPAHGAFQARAQQTAPSRFALRVPRQDDASLMLDFLQGENTLFSFELGSRILEMGYNWTAESLEDIELEIDYANARISVIVGGWEMSWAYSIEI